MLAMQVCNDYAVAAFGSGWDIEHKFSAEISSCKRDFLEAARCDKLGHMLEVAHN